jgi:hypothetical protein
MTAGKDHLAIDCSDDMTTSLSRTVQALTDDNMRLSQDNNDLQRRMSALESQLNELAESRRFAFGDVGGAQVIPTEGTRLPVHNAPLGRGTLLKAGAGALAAAVGVVLARPAVSLAGANNGVTAHTYDDFTPGGGTVSLPPLDSAVVWARPDVSGVGAGYTTEILSLLSANTQENSYAWPFYVELRATNHADADQDSSQSSGATVRAFNRSVGSPWLVGFHSEIHHGSDRDATPIDAHGTSIGYNTELTRLSQHGTAVGVEIMNTPHSETWGTHGLEITSTGPASGWGNGIHFSAGDDYVAGNIGINFDQAQYNMGLDLGDNSMRMNAGQSIVLEHFGGVSIKFNPSTGNIEFYKGDSLVHSI